MNFQKKLRKNTRQ